MKFSFSVFGGMETGGTGGILLALTQIGDLDVSGGRGVLHTPHWYPAFSCLSSFFSRLSFFFSCLDARKEAKESQGPTGAGEIGRVPVGCMLEGQGPPGPEKLTGYLWGVC